MCAERGVAMQTIKSIALAPWEGRPKTASTWYEPLTDPPTSGPRCTGCSAGPESSSTPSATWTLLPHVLAAAEAFDGEPPSDADVEALLGRNTFAPLFV